MPTNHLLSWGTNSHGQLGQGIISEQCLIPHKVDLSNCQLKLEKIKKIVGGAGHTLILDETGNVYSCGWNNKGQTGIFGQERSDFQQIHINLTDDKVVDVECGWDSSAALTEEGILYLWGSNNFGQLGQNPWQLGYSVEPLEMKFDFKIKAVSMGLRHTAVVTENDQVFVTGKNNKGQLGLNLIKKDVYAFTRVSELNNIKDVSCGGYHTTAITKYGEIYAWGDNKYGQLGIDPDLQAGSYRPVKSNSSDPDIEIHSGWTHTVFLNHGKIYSFGRNTYGQLGYQFSEKFNGPRCLENLPSVFQLSTGSEHNVILTENGTIYCWGWNEHGNCGNGDISDIWEPTPITIATDFTGVLVGAGAGHSFAVMKSDL